jgi:hypothetical protein
VWFTVGSMNFDNRSMALNDEATLMVLDHAAGQSMNRIFIDDLLHAEEITLQTFRRRSWLQRIAEWGAHSLTRLLSCSVDCGKAPQRPMYVRCRYRRSTLSKSDSSNRRRGPMAAYKVGYFVGSLARRPGVLQFATDEFDRGVHPVRTRPLRRLRAGRQRIDTRVPSELHGGVPRFHRASLYGAAAQRLGRSHRVRR